MDVMQVGEGIGRLKWSEMEMAVSDPCTHKRRQAKPSFPGRRSVWGRPSLLNVFNIAQARSLQYICLPYAARTVSIIRLRTAFTQCLGLFFILTGIAKPRKAYGPD
jgi:hypothetical protein